MNENIKKAIWLIKTKEHDRIYGRTISWGVCSACGYHTRVLSRGVSYPKNKTCPHCHAYMHENS